MQHNLIHHLRIILTIPLTPIITNRVRKTITSFIKRRSADRASCRRIAFETVFSDAVPEVEGAVRAGGGEGAVHGVEGDGVDGVDVGHVVGWGVAVAFEGEVRAGR